jgi:hypothetical protein
VQHAPGRGMCLSQLPARRRLLLLLLLLLLLPNSELHLKQLIRRAL